MFMKTKVHIVFIKVHIVFIKVHIVFKSTYSIHTFVDMFVKLITMGSFTSGPWFSRSIVGVPSCQTPMATLLLRTIRVCSQLRGRACSMASTSLWSFV